MPSGSPITAWPGWDLLPVMHFLILAATLIGGGLAVVTLRNLIHAALWLIVLFSATAALFLLLNAEFLAFAQILIYVGGISILILFSIMLSRKIVGWDLAMTNRQSPLAAIVCLLLAATLSMPGTGVIASVDWSNEPNLVFKSDSIPDGAAAIGITPELVDAQPNGEWVTTNWYRPNTAVLGQSLMTTYTLIFWVASFILTVAMVGALYIARKD